jgi:outer membrane protein assembly factor BamB
LYVTRYATFAVLLGLVIASIVAQSPSAAQAASGLPIIPREVAAAHGLERVWLAQIRVDYTNDRVMQILADEYGLVAVTRGGTITALDGETGATRWVTHVGRPEFPTSEAGANKDFVAVCNGSTIYVVSRADGSALTEYSMARPPTGAGPVVSDSLVFIGTVVGSIEGFTPRPSENARITFQGQGMIDVPPILAGDQIVFGTSEGFVYSASAETLSGGIRVDVGGPIRVPLAYRAPLVYVASDAGYLVAARARDGARVWQFATGQPIRSAPALIDDRLYLIAQHDGMYCLSATTGEQIWYTPGAAQFLAATASNVYAADSLGRLLTISAAAGGVSDRLDTSQLPLKVQNRRTDRLYLATLNGLLQCFREPGAEKPTIHEGVAPAAPAPAAATEPAADAAAGGAPAEAVPAADAAAPAEPDPAADPFP